MRKTITFFAADTITIRFAAVDETGAVLDLTDLGLVWALSKPARDVMLIQKTPGTGLIVTDAEAGLFEVALSPSDTAGMHGDYYHEVQLTDTDGSISTIYAEAVRIEKTLIPPV